MVQLCSWARGQRGQCQQRSTIYTRSCPPSYTNAQQLRLESTAGNCCLYNSLLFLERVLDMARWVTVGGAPATALATLSRGQLQMPSEKADAIREGPTSFEYGAR